MVKSVSTALDTHLNQEATTLATCWQIVREDGRVFTFTENSEDLPIDIVDGRGTLTYKASSSYSRSAIKNDDTLSVDNLDVVGVLSDEDVSEADLRKGLFDHAEVRIFLVNHQDLSQGILRMRKGRLGEVTLTPNGRFQAELRGLMQVFSRRVGELYSPECRADLGDSRCRVPIFPAEVQRNQVLAAAGVGDLGTYVRASNTKFVAQTLTNPDAESGTTGWTATTGSLATRGASPAPDVTNGGTAYFYGGANAETVAHQDVDVSSDATAIDAGQRSARLRWLQNSLDEAVDDQAEMRIEFYDVGAVQLGATVAAGLSAPLVWTERFLEATVPANTRTVRIIMRMVRNTVTDNDGLIDFIRLDLVNTTPLSEDFSDRIYRLVTPGTTAAVQPTYDTTVGQQTTDGTAVLEAEQAWSRAVEVVAVNSTDPRKTFTVTELTPNSGGTIVGRDHFPDDSMNNGAIFWESGANAGKAMEVRDFTADDGVTIEQIVELFLDLPFDVAVGDKARIYRGCFKRVVEDCKNIFNNVNNFRGEPYVPGKDAVFNYPNARA